MARLQAAEQAHSLDDASLKPWHLKMTVQLFDAKGDVADTGTIEEWWAGPDFDRREYKTGAYAATEIRKNGKVYRTKGADLPPYFLELLGKQIVHPVTPINTSNPPKPDLRKLNVGKVTLDCIELKSSHTAAAAPLGTVPTYCFEKGTDSFRLTLLLSSEAVERTSIGRFQGKEVAIQASVFNSNVKAATAHIETLASMNILPSEVEPTAEIAEVVPPIVTADDKIKVEPIEQAPPRYPEEAKFQHIAGTVVVRGIIGIDGRIRTLELISTSNKVLTGAAMEAVRHWRYKPCVSNGQPAEVETVVAVNFTFG